MHASRLPRIAFLSCLLVWFACAPLIAAINNRFTHSADRIAGAATVGLHMEDAGDIPRPLSVAARLSSETPIQNDQEDAPVASPHITA
jgi:hypothetical protein